MLARATASPERLGKRLTSPIQLVHQTVKFFGRSFEDLFFLLAVTGGCPHFLAHHDHLQYDSLLYIKANKRVNGVCCKEKLTILSIIVRGDIHHICGTSDLLKIIRPDFYWWSSG